MDTMFYNPVDIDDELFLSSVPLEILMNSLDTQFADPLEWRKKDYVQSFITKYNFSKDNMLEDDQNFLDVYHDQFMEHILSLFRDYLDVEIISPENMSDDDLNDCIHLTYRFFIKNIKKNFVSLIKNYIDNNEDLITERYENKKDVTALTFRAEIDNEYDILVLSNLKRIVDDVLFDVSAFETVEEFFELCKGDEVSLELEYVKHAYEEFDITGNFINKYIEMINEDFKSDIQSKIRNLILKKYGKRKPIVKEIEDDDISSTSEEENTESNED